MKCNVMYCNVHYVHLHVTYIHTHTYGMYKYTKESRWDMTWYSTLRTKMPMVRTSQGGRWCPMWNPRPGSGNHKISAGHTCHYLGIEDAKYSNHPADLSLQNHSKIQWIYPDGIGLPAMKGDYHFSNHSSSHGWPWTPEPGCPGCPAISSSVSAPSHQPWAVGKTMLRITLWSHFPWKLSCDFTIPDNL